MIKKIFLLLFLLIGFSVVKAQTPKPLSDDIEPITVHNLYDRFDSAYAHPNFLNFIRTWKPNRPVAELWDLLYPYRTVDEVPRETQYFDGLGRLIQTVSWQASPSKKDVVIPVYYDRSGRPSIEVLPYSAVLSPASSNDGNFKPTPFVDQRNYYKNATYNPHLAQENYFFTETMIENNPLQREMFKGYPGNGWRGNNRWALDRNRPNYANEIIQWQISDAPGSMPVSAGYYAEGQVYVNWKTDEDLKNTVEYKDKDDRILLKKTQLGNNQDTRPHQGWLNTYYVYDKGGKLRFILSPKAVEQLEAASWTFTGGNWQSNDIAKGLCFIYEYDQRRINILKKIPDQAPTEMVYDAKERLVMSRTGTDLPWKFTSYDSQDRPLATGLLDGDTNDRQYHADRAAGSFAYPSFSSGQVLTRTFYDDYSWVGAYQCPYVGYCPITNIDYEPVAGAHAITTPITDYPYAVPLAKSPMPMRGLVTGTMAKVEGANWYIYTTFIYDQHKRLIQEKKNNFLNGHDYTTTQYNFNGQPIMKYQLSETQRGVKTVMVTKWTYDAAGRNLTITKNANNTGEVQIVKKEYNENGQLKRKSVGDKFVNGVYTHQPVETQDFLYNPRGWLTAINKEYANGVHNNNWFGLHLHYNYGFYAPDWYGTYWKNQGYYNGNTVGIKWRGKGNGRQWAYGYTYDGSNRLKSAGFSEGVGPTYETTGPVNYSMNVGYDANGNISRMWQAGWLYTSSTNIDDITYEYVPNSNQLRRVNDTRGTLIPGNGDFVNPPAGGPDQYVYTSNGNIQFDPSRGATITYNSLNLPQILTLENTATHALRGRVTFTYDGFGNKLKKDVDDNSHVYAMDYATYYLDDFVYESYNGSYPKVGSIQHEDGRIVPIYDQNDNVKGFRYESYIKDHLNNVRMVLTGRSDTGQYLATMETAYRAKEQQLFYNISNTGHPVSQVTGYPSDNTTSPNDSLVRLNGNARKIGPSIVLRVMAGDKVEMAVKSFWKDQGPNGQREDPLADMLIPLAQGIISVGGERKGSFLGLGYPSSSPLVAPLTAFRQQHTEVPGVPLAFLNWMLLDDHFKYVTNGSGVARLGSANALVPLTGQSDIPKNGYLYIFLNNETRDKDVFFDNLSIRHITGPLVDETHYYPFGLTMTGISSKAFSYGLPENRIKFQSQEISSKEFKVGPGLEFYEFKWRTHDPQLGRFIQIDPLAEKYPHNSPYAFSENKVTTHVELEGLESSYIFNKFKREIADNFQHLANWIDNSVSFFNKSSSSTEISSTPTHTLSAGTTVTTTTKLNLGGNMSYIIRNNSNAGNNEPLTKTTTSITGDVKTEVKAPVVSITNKTSTGTDGVVTNTMGVKANVKIDGVPATIEATGGRNTNGEAQVAVQGAAGTQNTKAVGNVQYVQGQNSSSISVGVGAQQKAGKTTVITLFGIKFSFGSW